MVPKMDLASMMPRTDLSELMRRTDVSALLPQPSSALQGLMRELSTASTAARDDQHDDHDEDHDLTYAPDGDDTVDSDHEEPLR